MPNQLGIPLPGEASDASFPDIDLEQVKGRTAQAIDNQWVEQAVSSTHLSTVGFNSAQAKGKVAFTKGGVYEYDGCTQEEFESITGAASPGAAFRETWGNGQKPYRRIQ